jgi:hypothetical protein
VSEFIPSLGGQVGNWIQSHCAIPDGDRMGDPYLLTPEMWTFLLNYYRLDADGRFTYSRGAMMVRVQKYGKGPFAAAIICAEAAGPVRFDHFAPSGDPVGKSVATPWIQIAAVSEDQTANTYRALTPMIQLGDISAEIEDVGVTRINLPGSGRIEPVTAAARSRVGQRVTFAVWDETGFWLEGNHGRELADAMSRNLAGMRGRFLQTTNAWDPAEESVAQQTAEAGDPGTYVDDIDPGTGSIKNKRERRRMLKTVYGDSARSSKAQGNAEGQVIDGWVDLDRIDAEIEALLTRDPAQAERFFLNRKRATESQAFDPERWDELADPEHILSSSRKVTGSFGGRDVYGAGSSCRIVIGVDGARFFDSLALVATEVDTGYQWPLGIWTRPESADDDYEHPLEEVDGTMIEAFESYDVERVYIDPQYIENLVDRWQERWGDRVVVWWTNRLKAMAHAIRGYGEAIVAGDVTHNGDETFARHIKNANRRSVSVRDDEGRQMYVIGKDRAHSPRKMDAAVAAVISWEARRDCRQDSGKSGGESPSWFL